ncbi:MAG: aldo/keto reductase, partial [Lewinella sp.]|nr:aldo/keto reductase [Lewinella sp.]
DLIVSALSLGCMSFHTLDQGRPIIERALEGGINFFDTADLYDRGENERIVGKVLQSRRSEVIIATKVGNRWRDDGSGWDWTPRKDYILTAVEESLRRLHTDYIDLYQLHGGTIDDPLDEVVEAFEQLREQGKIRYYGISSIRPSTIRKWTEVAPGAVSCMTQYSLLDRRPEEATLARLQENGQGVLVRGAIAKGLLNGRTPEPYLDHEALTVAQLAGKLQVLAGEDPPGALAIRYVLQHPAVSTVVLGASRPEQLDDFVDQVSQPLPAETYDLLKYMAPELVYKAHR